MKIRIPVAFRVLLPFLVTTGILCWVFFAGRESLSPAMQVLVWTGAGGSVILGLVQMFWLRRHLSRVRSMVGRLTKGQLPSFPQEVPSDEIGDLLRDLEKHVNYLRSLTHFAGNIFSGDFSGTLEKLSDQDEISHAMLSLKASLEASAKETKARRTEEEHRTWTAQGLAKFSRLFREVEEDLESLSGALTKELVDYTVADVAAMFIATDPAEGTPLLELRGCYAFDRHKHSDTTFEFGEGLVGRAAMEKDLIYLTDLPAGTIKIRSGLGEDVPTSLLLVPLLVDNQVTGVIELASLDVFPDYQIEFLRQLAEALATTLAKVKANLRTRVHTEAYREFHKREQELLDEIQRLRKS